MKWNRQLGSQSTRSSNLNLLIHVKTVQLLYIITALCGIQFNVPPLVFSVPYGLICVAGQGLKESFEELSNISKDITSLLFVSIIRLVRTFVQGDDMEKGIVLPLESNLVKPHQKQNFVGYLTQQLCL